jgi:flavin reductase (DIM6/NTAB) family NADH-FMN oxidoreductase RutF
LAYIEARWQAEPAATAGSLAAPRVVECTVEYAPPGGDHEIIVGRVRHVGTNGDGAAPLVFWRGGYAP